MPDTPPNPNLLGLLPYQQRVVQESADLGQRLDALRTFVSAPMFASVAPEEQALLLEQAAWMTRYLSVLNKRVALWVGKP